jgi:glyoxylase I family protein
VDYADPDHRLGIIPGSAYSTLCRIRHSIETRTSGSAGGLGKRTPEQSGHRAPGRPTCDEPAYHCDLYHTIAYPVGPTCASNLGACVENTTGSNDYTSVRSLMRCLTAALRQNVAVAAPAIIGLGHLDFTVTDGDRAMQWWKEVMGFKLLAKWEEPGYRGWTMAHPCGLVVTAVTHAEGDASPFDERKVGLDHVAFRVSDLAALEAWANRLDALRVTHSGVKTFKDAAGVR